MMLGVRITTLGLIVVSATGTASAQVTVQQPVFQSFSGATTISVPDRGGAFIGGVGSAGSSRSAFGFGPRPPGSSIGSFRDHSGLSAHVQIHDLAEMDRMVLQQAGTSETPPRFADRHAEHAYGVLLERSGDRGNAWANPISARRSAAVPPVEDQSAKFLNLGQKAEARGAVSVARMHYRLAARHGSTEAAERLRELERFSIGHSAK